MINKTEFVRVKKTRDYSVISNEFLRRKDLSWKAKGIMAYILTLPDDWDINLKEVMTHATEGERAFRSGWKELTEAGYVERRPIREGQRITHWETIVYENVGIKPNSLDVRFEDVQNEDVHFEVVQNVELLNTNNTNYLNILSTDNKSQQSQKRYADDSPYMQLSHKLRNHILARDPKHKEPNWQKWADDMRKLSELDGRSIKEIEDVIDWSQQDDFWQDNILSPKKLRDKFSTLYMQAQKSGIFQSSLIHEYQIDQSDIEAFEQAKREGWA